MKPQFVLIGCGNIGLPMAVAFASRGGHVVGIDTDEALVSVLKQGRTRMLDPGLEPALRRALEKGQITFSSTVSGQDFARIWIVAVPTSLGPDRRLDASAFNAAIATISKAGSPGDLVLIRSTVPVGTTRETAARLADRGFLFAACPDRSLAGQSFEDQFSIPNIVGGMDEPSSKAAAAVLETLGTVVNVSSPEAAEVLKLITNTWRDSRFAIANQFANICRAVGVDFEEVRHAGAVEFSRFDVPRSGPVGGPCLSKDVYLLAQAADRLGCNTEFLQMARRVNQLLADEIVTSVSRACLATPEPCKLAVLGLAFKGRPPTLDRRDSIAEAILRGVAAAAPETKTMSWDPVTDAGDGTLAVVGAHVIVLANDHPKLSDPALLQACAAKAIVYDLCGVLIGNARADLRVRRLSSAANWS